MDQQNKELLTRIDELQGDVKLLNEDVQTRDNRIDKLNEVGSYIQGGFLIWLHSMYFCVSMIVWSVANSKIHPVQAKWSKVD